jgi:glutathione S-transferase
VKLFYSPTSPFVRKVLASAIIRDIDGQIALVPTSPHDSPASLLAANPLSKVPCLVTVDGLALFDSPVICEFLDSVGDAPPLFPRAGGARWMALKHQAIADGLLDAAILRRGEQRRPRDAASEAVNARQQGVMARALDDLERDLPHKTPDIGAVAVACALGYLDLRFAAEPWRDGHPQLAGWFEEIMQTPGLARTVPADPT